MNTQVFERNLPVFAINLFSIVNFAIFNLSVTCWLIVGRLSVVCRPTVDRQSADRFFGEPFFTITIIPVRTPRDRHLLASIPDRFASIPMRTL